MRYFILGLLLFFVFAVSCRKGELPTKSYYYGNVHFELVSYPNTPPLKVKFNGDTVSIGGANLLPAGVSGKLEVFDAAADTLITDSTIIVPKDGQLDFKFVYATDIGVSGFLNTAPYAADTAYISFQNALEQSQYPDPVDIQMFTMNNETGAYDPLFAITDVQHGKLTKTFSLPGFDANGNGFYYYATFIDSKTKQPITNDPVFVGAGGTFLINQLISYPDGSIYPNYITF